MNGIHECLGWTNGWMAEWKKKQELLQWFNELTGRRTLVLNHFVQEKKKQKNSVNKEK